MSVRPGRPYAYSWIVQIFNQTYVPALYQTVTLDLVNFCWDIYMTLTLAGSDDDTDGGEDSRRKNKKK